MDWPKTRAHGNGAASEDHETINCPALAKTGPERDTFTSDFPVNTKHSSRLTGARGYLPRTNRENGLAGTPQVS